MQVEKFIDSDRVVFETDPANPTLLRPSQAGHADLAAGLDTPIAGLSEHLYQASAGALGLTQLAPGGQVLPFSTVDFNVDEDVLPLKADLSGPADLTNDPGAYFNLNPLPGSNPRSAYILEAQLALNTVPIDGQLTLQVAFNNTLGDALGASQTSTFLLSLQGGGDQPVIHVCTRIGWLIAATFLNDQSSYALVYTDATWTPSDGNTTAPVNSYRFSISRLT